MHLIEHLGLVVCRRRACDLRLRSFPLPFFVKMLDLSQESSRSDILYDIYRNHETRQAFDDSH